MKKKIETPATDLEKILIATGAINYMASVVAMVKRDYDSIAHANPGEQIYKDGLERHAEALRKATAELTKITEDLGNYINNCDMADEQIIHITGAALDVLYDRIEA